MPVVGDSRPDLSSVRHPYTLLDSWAVVYRQNHCDRGSELRLELRWAIPGLIWCQHTAAV